MSYILDALKKAQAERQLGNAPTIHAPPPVYAAQPTGGGRTPLYVGLGLAVLGLAAVAVFLLRQPAPVVPVVPVAVAPAPVAVPPVAVPAAPVPVAPVPMPEPVKVRETPVKPKPAPAPLPKAEAPPRVAPVVTEAPPPAVDDNVGPLAALPEAVQRDIPKVAFGGYIYSPNPAERLLLVDKMLRREGEEVAPGLVLERLLPKAAIMNYRGYRYRVAY